MSNNKQIKLGVVLSYVTLFVSNIISIVYTPFLLRMLGQSEYGLYSLMSTFITYLNLLDLGLGNAMIVFISKSLAKDSKADNGKIIGSFLKIYLILGLIVLIAGIALFLSIDLLFASQLTSTELSRAKIMFLILLVPMVVSFPLGVYSALITIQEKFVFQKILNLIKIIVVPVIMIPLLLLGYKSIAVVAISSIVSLAVYLINYIYCKKNFDFKIKFEKIERSIFKEIFSYSFFIFLGMIIDKINNGIDSMILGATAGTVAVSIYAIGAQFNNIYISFSTSMSSILLPKISKMVAKNVDDDDISDLFIKTGRIQFIILLLILTGFILFGNEFIKIWAGIEYDISYYIALILMIPYTVPLIQNVGISILQAKNKNKFRALCYLIVALINVIISIPLAKLWQGVGSSLGTAFAIILGNIIIMNIYYKKSCNINIKKFWKEIIKIFLSSCIPIMIGVVLNLIIPKGTYLLVLTKIIIYTIAYLVSVYFLGMNVEEKKVILNVINKFKKVPKHDKIK